MLFRERGAGPSGRLEFPSRFVRLAFLKKYAVPGKDEPEGVGRMMRLFQSAAFPLGLVRVSHTAAATALDWDVLPYDYTVYTAVYCAESLRAYWTDIRQPLHPPVQPGRSHGSSRTAFRAAFRAACRNAGI